MNLSITHTRLNCLLEGARGAAGDTPGGSFQLHLTAERERGERFCPNLAGNRVPRTEIKPRQSKQAGYLQRLLLSDVNPDLGATFSPHYMPEQKKSIPFSPGSPVVREEEELQRLKSPGATESHMPTTRGPSPAGWRAQFPLHPKTSAHPGSEPGACRAALSVQTSMSAVPLRVFCFAL